MPRSAGDAVDGDAIVTRTMARADDTVGVRPDPSPAATTVVVAHHDGRSRAVLAGALETLVDVVVTVRSAELALHACGRPAVLAVVASADLPRGGVDLLRSALDQPGDPVLVVHAGDTSTEAVRARCRNLAMRAGNGRPGRHDHRVGS